MKVTYVPVFFGIKYGSEHLGELRLSKLNWYNRDAIWYYPYTLVSAGSSGMDVNNMRIRDKFKIDDDVTIVGDCGGFQSVTLNKYLNPIAILRWQEANSNIAPILDKPPFDTFAGYTKTSNFDKCLKETADNARVMYSSKESKSILQYGVVQGVADREIKLWYDKIFEQGTFDGWALAPKPPAVDILVRFLKLAYNEGMKNIHIFQCTGLDCFLLAVYINHHYIKANMTLDSVSYLRSEKYGQILNPLTLTDVEWAGRKEGKDTKIICHCPICTNYSEIIEKNRDSKHINFFYCMNIHNLFHMAFFVDSLNEYVKDIELYDQLIGMYANKPDLVRRMIKQFESGKDGNKSIFGF